MLRTHDRYGNRVGEVELDPSWHWILREAVERGIHSLPWRDPQPGAHTVRAALMYVWNQVNGGVMCPVSMTYSVIPALRENPDLAEEWEPRLVLEDYDKGALAGMAMTEKQGGSDVRANTTRAEPQSDGTYEITGHKWFCSYPPCDVFLTLAQAPEGLSCFLIEGRDPGFRVQRLKDKLGTRSLPSSEVEFMGVRGRLVGEEGRGVPTIIRMVNHTRLDCLIGSASSMRWGTAQAVHHARHRSAFGKLLAEQPAMQNVLADLAIESEAATATAHAHGPRLRRGRLGVPALRHRRGEVLGVQARPRPRERGARVPRRERLRGGVGHAPPLPRRPAQLDLGGLGQRGGAGRAARDGQGARGPAGVPRGGGGGGGRERAPGRPPRADEGRRWSPRTRSSAHGKTVEDLGLALQASLLVRNAPPEVADAFCAARLGNEGGRAYGTLPSGVDARGDRRASPDDLTLTTSCSAP